MNYFIARTGQLLLLASKEWTQEGREWQTWLFHAYVKELQLEQPKPSRQPWSGLRTAFEQGSETPSMQPSAGNTEQAPRGEFQPELLSDSSLIRTSHGTVSQALAQPRHTDLFSLSQRGR